MFESISDWLDGFGLGEYSVAFAENKIDWAVLPHLTGDDLKEIGVAAVGDRRKLLTAIDQLVDSSRQAMPPVTTSPSTPEPLATTRRQVTVLFADLVGFTSLTSRVDAEEVHALLNRYFDVVDAAVVRYGGRIDKHIGDAVMAVFGAPFAHTNDPERALRAAMEIHEVVARLDPPLNAHVGVASGQVVASATGSDAHVEYTVTGDGVNLASRLTDMAGVGETFASQAVRRAVGEMFQAESRGECHVKGLTESIEVWRIVGLTKASGRPEDGIFGRANELSRLAAALKACRSDKLGRVVVLRGEPGIGKSRLLKELGHFPEAGDFLRVQSTVLDFGAEAERAPLHAVTRGLLGLGPDANEMSRANAAQSIVESGRVEEAYLPHLHILLVLPLSADQAQNYAGMDNLARTKGRRAVLNELVESACRRSPVLIEIEDVHWADKQDLADLGHLAASIKSLPVMVVMTTRRAEDPLDSDWIASLDGTPLIALDLTPLGIDDARRLAEAQRSFDPVLLKTCIDRAEGNPLFLQQLLRNADRMNAGELPDSIQGIVQARLDGLALDERVMLQSASVLGQRFSCEALQYLLDDQDARPEGLIRETLLIDAGGEIAFAHALIRDGAYESLLRSQRAELHQRAADWYAERDLALHARHLDRAGAPAAAVAYLVAANHFTDTFEHNRALPLLERALELEATDCRFDIECAHGDVLRAVGESGRALEAFAQVAARADGDAQRVRAHIGLAQVARQASHYEQALDSLAVAQEAAERLGSDMDLAEVHYLRGNLFFPLGRIDDILASTKLALGYAEKTKSTRIKVGGFSNFGDANYMKGAMLTAESFYTKAIKLARADGLNRDLAANLHNRGAARLYLCKIGPAKADAEESLSLARKYFAPVAECVALASLGAAILVEGDMDAVLRLSEEGIRLGAEIGAQRFEAQARGYAARALFFQGRLDEARVMGQRGAELALSAARNFSSPKELSILALTLSDPQEQDRLLSQGADILAEGCVSHCHLFFYSDAIRIMLARRNWDAALHYCDCLEAFTCDEPLPLSDLIIRQCRLLVDCGRQNQTDNLAGKLDEFRAVCSDLGIKQTLSGLVDRLPN